MEELEVLEVTALSRSECSVTFDNFFETMAIVRL